MRLGDGPSGNFEDRTGQGGGFGGFGGGGGGNMLGCLLPLVMSRFGMIGVVILLLGYCALQSLGGGGGSILGGGGGAPTTQSAPAGQSTLAPENRRVLVGTLESTDQVWGKLFQASGSQYEEPRLVAYTRGTQTGCGAGQAMMGPFYCPTDRRIYIDPTFFEEMRTRFGASGDFAQAYVIAHEVGHHVQNLLGQLEHGNEEGAERGSVRTELQADCYAGIWAHATGQRDLLEQGDLDEAMRAAEAIGDDTLQKSGRGTVQPETWTHGSSAQRQRWFRKGFENGRLDSCDTFAASDL